MWKLIYKLFVELPVKLLRFPFDLARFIVRQSWMFIILAVVTTIVLVPGIDDLETKGGFDTLVSTDSKVFKDTQLLEAEFGGDPLVVMLKGSVDDIFSPEGLIVLEKFEMTFEPEADSRVYSIISPVTILKTAAEEAAHKGFPFEWNSEFLVRIALGDAIGIEGDVISQLPESDSEGISAALELLRSNMAHLVPDSEHVLITVNFAGGLDYDTSIALLDDIDSFIQNEQNLPPNTTATVTGDLMMIDEISKAIGSNMTKLLIMSVVVMAVILLIAFRVRWNLLALLMVGLAALWTFGIMGYIGIPLSMATMAVLPILIGLGVDYSIQFHKRYQEEAEKRGSVSEALTTSTARMFPSVGIALVSTLIGFVTLLISEVPMIRDFGLLLAIGMLISYGVAFFTLNSIINILERRLRTISLGKMAQAVTRFVEQGLSLLARTALRFPLILLLISVSAATAGAVVDQWLPANSDFESLMPQGAKVLKNIDEVRQVQGNNGQLRFMIEADDVTDPKVLGWIEVYQNEMIRKYSISENQSDSDNRVIAGVDSPVTLITQWTNGAMPDAKEVGQILQATPDIFVKQFISGDRHSGQMLFYLKYDSVEDVNNTIDGMMRDARAMAIPGIRIAPGGSMALGAKALNAMMGKRYLMNELCMGATFFILLLMYRRLTRAIFTIIPVSLVIGWISLPLYFAGVALNPMTAVLGVLVVGIGTEFMVLILGRYQEERKHIGSEPRIAMTTAIATTGQAIVATALTTLGGFGVLISSNFVLIRDFGIATTIAVFLCLLSSMIVMPPLIVWWDRKIARRLPSWL